MSRAPIPSHSFPVSTRLSAHEENKEDMTEILAKRLRAAGFETDIVTTEAAARTALTTTQYAAVVLDLGLSDNGGLSVLGNMSGRNEPVPVLLLSSRASVKGIEGLRRNDYLVVQSAVEELLARLETALGPAAQLPGTPLRVSNLVFDTKSREAFIDNQPHHLRAREVAVLEPLMRCPGRVVPKKLLEERIFGRLREVKSNAVEVYVHRLRNSLAERGAKVEIHTIKGVGYVIVERRW
jgi:DNA-binding response OmpR family regulator